MAEAKAKFGAIVLAAGASRRMGTAKAILPINRLPMILGIVGRIGGKLLVDPIVVVTGHQPELIRQALAPLGEGIEFVHNSAPDEGGMLSSVQVGLRAIKGRVSDVFIVLGDQPLVRELTYMKLASSKPHDAMVVRPMFHGKRGHPILIDASCIDQILALPANATLNDFVTAPTTSAIDVKVNDESITLDVDTPGDYEKIISRLSYRARKSSDE